MKQASRWYSQRLQQDVAVVRWGDVGAPVLVFPTAGGDAEEIERFLLVGALAPLMESGRVKVYSCDSVSGRAWLDRGIPARQAAWVQNQFDAFIYHELVPAIRQDCRSETIEILTAGASIGAFNAVAVLCRHPDAFCAAVGMSGTYDLDDGSGERSDLELYFSSPIRFVPNLSDGKILSRLRERFIILAFGQGRWEDPEQSWRMASVLGSKGVPNRVDPWGPEWDHDWPTWREMLPRYLDELVDESRP